MLPTEMVLTDPLVVDLDLPDDLVDDGVCHTQGMAFDGDDLVLSCVVFDPERPERKTSHSRALLLRGAHEGERAWRVTNITEPVSADISRRVTRQELEREVLTADEAAIVRVMSHPSGLVEDAGRGGVWVANAVYTAKSHTRLVLVGSDNEILQSVDVPAEHVGAIALVRERYMVGWTWDSKHVVVIDLGDGPAAPVVLPNPLLDSDDLVAIQDCYTWDDEHVLCSGMYKYTAGDGADEVRHRVGRLQLLHIDVSNFPRVTVRHIGYMSADFGDGPTAQIGLRSYRVDENDEDVQLHENDYGGYVTHAELTHEAMTLSSDRRYMYFVPDDLPNGKMLRFTLRVP